jgi:hypothetical protein
MRNSQLDISSRMERHPTLHTSHFTCQHGRNSVLFWRPRHFEGTLATVLARSDAVWLFLMGISERESLPKQTTNHRRVESKHIRRHSGSDNGRTGKDFPKHGAPGSIVSGHFQHMLRCRHISHTKNVLLFEFRCNILIGVGIIKEMPGSVASGTLCSCVRLCVLRPQTPTVNTSCGVRTSLIDVIT